LKRRPSAAIITASIALFFSLTGTGLARQHYPLPKAPLDGPLRLPKGGMVCTGTTTTYSSGQQTSIGSCHFVPTRNRIVNWRIVPAVRGADARLG
jgi:hypothetical protein